MKPFHDKHGTAIKVGDIVYSEPCAAHFRVTELANENTRKFLRADNFRNDQGNPTQVTLSKWDMLSVTADGANLDEAPDHKPMQPAQQPEPYDPPTRRARKPKPEAPELDVHARYAEFRALATRVFAEMAPKATLVVTDLVQKEPAMFMLEYDVGTGRNQCCWEARTSMSSLERFVRDYLAEAAVALLAKK